ncbi:eEF1A lysine and N-terminal methyltransferase-like, partial [Sycon ciliatum]|uniref:eEF1A lysine and N-terminal methyltransferase-like n=1 Tax=Sycon ciliatum TaxID=27933 RepID=UPI0031F62A8F
MDLLPRSVEEFRNAQYWDGFFKKRGKEGTFEWYGEYNDLCGVLHKYCKAPHRTLVVGCGNSRLSEDLYDVGYRSLVNIDISDVAVRQMAERNAQRRPGMQFLKMDMRELTFDDGHFDCVLDKATLDAIMAEDNADISRDVTAIFDEITRVLKAGGRYICVSLAQGHILRKLISYFPENWFVRVHKVDKQSASKRDAASALPVFVFVFTKKINTSMPQVLELCLHGEGHKPERVNTTDEFRDNIKDAQNFALLWQRLRSIHVGEETQFDLWASSGSEETKKEPRFTLHVVDNARVRTSSGQFAVFIVPQGRETEWMFSSSQGRQQLVENADFRRLVVVLLHRFHKYGSLAEIREELSGHVADLAPEGGKGRFPVLSTGDDAGDRDVICTGSSEFSGDYVVEDFIAQSRHRHRRLIFLSNRNVVQSEARLYFEDQWPSDRPLPPIPAMAPPETEEKAALSKNQKKKARKAKAKANKAAAAAEASTTDATEGDGATAAAASEPACDGGGNGQAAAASTEPATTARAEAEVEASKVNGDTDTSSAAAATAEAAEATAVTTTKTDSVSVPQCQSDEPLDVSYLACEHHKAMVCCLAVVRGLSQATGGSQKAMLVGLGGGSLARFIHAYIPPVSLEVVELDPKILDIAREWFGLREDSRLSVHVDDGLKFVADQTKKEPRPQYSAIMFDVDGKDSSVGMSCPPVAFVEHDFLVQVKDLLHPHGVFILNLVCRDVELQASIVARISSIFAAVYWLDIPNEVNRIVVALAQPVPCMHSDSSITTSAMDFVKQSGDDLEKLLLKTSP